VTEEDKLSNLDEQPAESLKALFKLGTKNLMDKIFAGLEPKKIHNKPLTGSMLLNLAFEYTEALNLGGVPQILPSLERIISAEIRKITDDLLIEYHENADELFGEIRMPMEEEEIRKRYRGLTQNILTKFDKMCKDIGEVGEVLELRSEVVEKMEKDFSDKIVFNDENSQDLCKKLINEFFNSFQLPAMVNFADIKESLIKDHRNDFIKFYENYKSFARGPHKYDLFSDCMPSFLFDYFEKYLDSARRIQENELNEVKALLNHSRTGEEMLKSKIQEQESLLFEYQKEKDTYKRELEKNEREYNGSLRKKTNEEQYMTDKIKDLELALERKKKKIQDLKKGKLEAEQTLEKLKIEMLNAKKQASSTQTRMMDLEKDLLTEKTQKMTKNEKDFPDIAGLVTNLRDQINSLKGSIPDTDKIDRKSIISAELVDKEREIAEIKDNYGIEIKKAKDDYKAQLSALKERYAQEKDGLMNQLDEFMNENSKLKVQIVDHTNCGDIIKNKEQMIDNLKEEKRRLIEALNSSSSKFDTNVNVLEVFKRDIEKKTNIVSELEMQIGQLKSDNSEMKSKKYDLLYAAKEAIKKAAKKNHQLKQAIKNIDEDDANDIRNALKEAGIPMTY